MSDTGNPTFQIPNDIIKPILEAHVQAALAKAFGDGSRLLEVAVSRVLNQQVDGEGKVSHYTRSDSPTWLEWLMAAKMREAISEALVKGMEVYKERIKAQVVKEIGNSKSGLAKQLITAMVENLTDRDNLRYRLQVTYTDKKQ
jgi:hypothetical protein